MGRLRIQHFAAQHTRYITRHLHHNTHAIVLVCADHGQMSPSHDRPASLPSTNTATTTGIEFVFQYFKIYQLIRVEGALRGEDDDPREALPS